MTLSISDYKTLRAGWLENEELERIWKEAVMA
jgi:hypothetical protein